MNDDDAKFNLIMMMHFPNVTPGHGYALNCKECQDFQGGECEGKNLKGADVISCMEGKLKNSIIEVHQALIQ